MGKLKRWWKQLGYLTIEPGLPGFFSFSFLFLSWLSLSSAQKGAHLTHTHGHTHHHTRGPVGQLQFESQNILHMAISSPPLLLVVYSLLVLSPSPSLPFVLSSMCRLTWSVVETLTRNLDAHTNSCAHTDRQRGGKGLFCRMLERIEGEWGGRERKQEKREGTQREERKCKIGGGKTKWEKQRGSG